MGPTRQEIDVRSTKKLGNLAKSVSLCMYVWKAGDFSGSSLARENVKKRVLKHAEVKCNWPRYSSVRLSELSRMDGCLQMQSLVIRFVIIDRWTAFLHSPHKRPAGTQPEKIPVAFDDIFCPQVQTFSCPPFPSASASAACSVESGD